MNEQAHAKREHQNLNMIYSTYADILFVLFPFLVIALQGWWRGELAEVLLRPDLSVASAVLAGLAIGRFVLGLIANRELGHYKERIVFFIAATLFTVLGPSLLLILLILGEGSGEGPGEENVPQFVSFAQPILLIIAISLYTTAVSVSNILSGYRGTGPGAENRRDRDGSDEFDEDDEELALPPRQGRTGTLEPERAK